MKINSSPLPVYWQAHGAFPSLLLQPPWLFASFGRQSEFSDYFFLAFFLDAFFFVAFFLAAFFFVAFFFATFFLAAFFFAAFFFAGRFFAISIDSPWYKLKDKNNLTTITRYN